MGLTIELEEFDKWWADAKDLAASHFAEANGDLEPNRPYKLDVALYRKLSELGFMRIFSARIDGRLVGYLMWQVMTDPESAGLLIASQGPWFVESTPESATLRVWVNLYKRTVECLREAGVKYIFPHHTTRGRGSRLGAFFKRLGAKESKVTYSLWIGD